MLATCLPYPKSAGYKSPYDVRQLSASAEKLSMEQIEQKGASKWSQK